MGRPKHVKFAPGTKGRILVPSTELTAYQRKRVNQTECKFKSSPRKADGTNEYTQVIEQTPAGLLVAHSRLCAPLRSVFAPGSPEYEAVIQAHENRVRAEMERLVDEEFVPGDQPDNPKSSPEDVFGRLPGDRKWSSLSVVDCRGCRIRLLARSEEKVRSYAIRRGMKCAKHIPPPVEAVIDGFCFCTTCMEEFDAGAGTEGRSAG